MKMLTIILAVILPFFSISQNDTERMQGAWKSSYVGDDGSLLEVTAIVMDNYIAEAAYNSGSGKFEWTVGGAWELSDGKFMLSYEWSSGDTSLIGTRAEIAYTFQGDDDIIFESDRLNNWTRIDDGVSGDLSAPWLITGRKRDGEIQRRTPGSRKTMKILSSTRFQWIAYDIDKKAFRGSGGGKYTAQDGDYIEEIMFFSRDDTRVGAKLSFKYDIIDSEWHHSGLSSKGDPIYEIWTDRNSLEKT